MQNESLTLRAFPPSIADAPAPEDEWAKSPVSALSDAALVEAVAFAVTPPKAEADSSFLTHAPLELAARAALLPLVEPSARDGVRRRIAAIASLYHRAGDEVEGRERDFGTPARAIDAIREAIDSHDFETLDAALLWLIPRASPLNIRRALAADVIPLLSAAGHLPIFLSEMPRLEARLRPLAHLLRAPMRKLARHSEFRLTWMNAKAPRPIKDNGETLFEALVAPPPVASPSHYIAPMMLAVEAGGYAARLLADPTEEISPAGAARAILRIGALSMLQDDPAHAPYGWTHALTMPQGVFGCADAVADKRMLVRVAATHALGFRATQGKARLVDAPPPRPRSEEIFNVAPIEAAGAAYHADEEKIVVMRTALATRAACHRDAHLAKYTLACFDAAARDPEASRLFLAAAAYLGAWWDAHPEASFE